MIPQRELAALRAEWTLDQGVIERDLQIAIGPSERPTSSSKVPVASREPLTGAPREPTLGSHLATEGVRRDRFVENAQ